MAPALEDGFPARCAHAAVVLAAPLPHHAATAAPCKLSEPESAVTAGTEFTHTVLFTGGISNGATWLADVHVLQIGKACSPARMPGVDPPIVASASLSSTALPAPAAHKRALYPDASLNIGARACLIAVALHRMLRPRLAHCLFTVSRAAGVPKRQKSLNPAIDSPQQQPSVTVVLRQASDPDASHAMRVAQAERQRVEEDDQGLRREPTSMVRRKRLVVLRV